MACCKIVLTTNHSVAETSRKLYPRNSWDKALYLLAMPQLPVVPLFAKTGVGPGVDGTDATVTGLSAGAL